MTRLLWMTEGAAIALVAGGAVEALALLILWLGVRAIARQERRTAPTQPAPYAVGQVLTASQQALRADAHMRRN